jgi:GAF domain-containing protein
MSNPDALAILQERRGKMYDPHIVDIFVRAYQHIMPEAESVAHPVTRSLGEARAPRIEPSDVASASPVEAATSEVLAVASLARAISGDATLADVGALTWMMLRQVVPCTSMGIFLYDESEDAVILQYADGVHATAMRGARRTLGSGIVGWSAANRRFVLNGDPTIDLGPSILSFTPPLRSSLTIPLVHDNSLIAVVSLYASTPEAFTDDHARLLTLLSPSLATSIASLDRATTPASGERRRAASGELRLLRR